MSRYSALVIDHFDHPRHSGQFEPAADVIEGTAGRIADGVQFTLSARIAGDVIADVRFRALGCPHCIAAASWLSERLVGMSRQELAQWHWREVAAALWVPTDKRGRMLVLEDAVRALGQQWLRLL